MDNKFFSLARLEQTIQQWRNDGSHKGILQLIYKVREFYRRIMQVLFFNTIVKKVRNTGPIADTKKLFRIASRGWFGIISPIQSKYEFISLLEELSKHRISRVLEIGTASGGTLFMYTRIADKDATIVSVDLPGGTFGGGYPTKKIPLYKSFALPEQRLELIRDDSHSIETLKMVEDIFDQQPVDFLFIDGDHTYEGVKSDYEMYSKLVSKNGFIAFHDTLYAEGVARFWSEVKLQHENTWEWVSDQKPQYGIGLIQI